jgi:hypothetical protein
MYELDEEVCRQMLARCSFGRVAFDDADDGLSVLPVNCRFVRNAVLVRTQEGSALDGLGGGVLIRGMANHVRDPQRIAALADSALQPWAPGRRDRWLEIQAEQITGRIIRRHRLVSEDGSAPYMPPE